MTGFFPVMLLNYDSNLNLSASLCRWCGASMDVLTMELSVARINGLRQEVLRDGTLETAKSLLS